MTNKEGVRRFFESMNPRQFTMSAEGMRVYDFMRTVDPSSPVRRVQVCEGAGVTQACAHSNLKLLLIWGHVTRSRVINRADDYPPGCQYQPGFHYAYGPAADPPTQKPTLRGIEMHKRRLMDLLIGRAEKENPFNERLRVMADKLGVSYSHVQRAAVELERESCICAVPLYYFNQWGTETRRRAGTRYLVIGLPKKGRWTEPGALAAAGVYERSSPANGAARSGI